ncbi:MAG: PP2C family protein-serine/threonine phosphatase [Candidatus Acidiferrales bacterium]
MVALAHETNTESGERIIPRILIADDQPDVLEALRLLLKRQGYEIETVSSPAAVVDALDGPSFDLLLMDLNYARDTTSGREGLDLLAQVKSRDSGLPIVVMTGWGTVGLAVEVMQGGVGDFIQKPWENARLLEVLRTQVERGRTRRENLRREAEKESRSQEAVQQLHRKEQEIEEAREIQKGFLPKEIPQIEGYQVAGAWQPAFVVGGDYYDVLRFSAAHVGFCIADVAGKGIPAALLMSNLQATVRGTASGTIEPAELCTVVNRAVCRNIAPDRFVTFFYALLDAGTKKMTYVNAGHNSPMVLRRDGSCVRLGEGGDVLGLFPNGRYEQGELILQTGDRVILYTDGLTEARNTGEEEFGEQRLLALLGEEDGRGADTLKERIRRSVSDFCGDVFSDDATFIVLVVE